MDEIPPAVLVDDSADRNKGGHSWKVRRRMMFSVVGFSMACIMWALWKDSDTAVMQTAVTMSFSTLISVTGTYVFGAVWSDKR